MGIVVSSVGLIGGIRRGFISKLVHMAIGRPSSLDTQISPRDYLITWQVFPPRANDPGGSKTEHSK